MTPQRTGPWKNPRWNSLKGPDADILRTIFQDLEAYLRNPTFENGISIGDGSEGTADPSTGVKTLPPVTLVDPDYLNSLSDVPDDGGNPAATSGLTVSPGVKSLFLSWTASTAVDVKDGWGQYRVQVGPNSGFTSLVVDKVTGSTFTTVTGLTTGTTYHCRIAAVDAFGNQGTFSSDVTGTPGSVATIDIGSGVITAANIQANTITAAEIAADAITASELSAVNLAVGKYIRSNSYSAGSSGWSINASGNAEFNNVTVRGDIKANTFTSNSGSGGYIAIQSGSTDVLVWTDGTSASTTGFQSSSIFTLGSNTDMRIASSGSIYLRPSSGHVEIDRDGDGLVIRSLNGSRWLVGVSNAGALQVAPA